MPNSSLEKSKKTRIERYRGNHKNVRECAAKVLEHLHAGNEGMPSGFSQATLRLAIRLLSFENLIRLRQGFILNETGKSHIKKHGFCVYPLDTAKNPL